MCTSMGGAALRAAADLERGGCPLWGPCVLVQRCVILYKVLHASEEARCFPPSLTSL